MRGLLAALVALAMSVSATWGSAQPAPQRLSARSAAYELVAVADGTALTLYLDRYATNEPVGDAMIEILSGNTTVRAEPTTDGTYRASVPGLAAATRHLLVFSIRHTGGDDLLEGEINGTAGAGPHGAPTSFWEALLSPKTLLLALLLGLAGGIALGHRYLPARDPG